MTETKRCIRRFILTVVWTLFFAGTLCGIITAGERTEFIRSGKEPTTVVFDITEKIAAIVR